MTADGVRRQARGERRIAQILDAAATVLARDGYEGATTNAIAREAGISPGSLYQFFRNKEEVAAALTVRYTTELRAAQARSLEGLDPGAMSWDALVGRVLAPLVAFNAERAGFKALFARADMPPALREATAPLHDALQGRVAQILAVRSPEADPDELRRAAVVAIQLVRGMMPLVVAASGDERDALDAEMRRAVVSYLSGHPALGR
ncbi:TetR/AcrR family transcriptional regulator [Cellulosimicrobium sp. PMB13]|uniref:TetR/AcrR family transcriptional regulator n=1 Tax=Cellulosimicrobium sp. PMB13 TaxID=3120158 RepID=UPI003F4B0EFA